MKYIAILLSLIAAIGATAQVPPAGAVQLSVKNAGPGSSIQWTNAATPPAVFGVDVGGVMKQLSLGAGFSVVDGQLRFASTSGTWGSITGTLSAQTDLQTALNARQPLASVLTNTTASFTTALETKLNGIAAGAEVNVNPDWTATSGDAQILNKPTTLAGYGITDANPLPASPTEGDYYALIHLRGSGTYWSELTGMDPNQLVSYRMVLSNTRTGLVLPAWDDESPGMTTLRSADHNGLVDLRLPFASGTLALTSDIPAAVTPAGSGSELQFRSSGSAFGAVTGSSVSGGAMTLGATLTTQAIRPTADNIYSLGEQFPGNRFVDLHLSNQANVAYLRLGPNQQYVFPVPLGTTPGFRFTNAAGDGAAALIMGLTTTDFIGLNSVGGELWVREANDSDFEIVSAKGSHNYRAWTSATNYERFVLKWDGTTARVGTEKGSSGGSARPVSLVTDGTNRLTIDALGHIIPVLPTSAAGLPSGALWNDGGTVKVAP